MSRNKEPSHKHKEKISYFFNALVECFLNFFAQGPIFGLEK